MVKSTGKIWQRKRRYFALMSIGIATLTIASFFYFKVSVHFHTVVDNKVYRSAQPSPAQLRHWTSRYGIKTVVNLRNIIDEKDYSLDLNTTEELGISLERIRWDALSHPPRREIHKLIDVIETSNRPLLLHCRRGVDRTGVASVIAAMAIGKQNYDDARNQVSWRYLKFGIKEDGIDGVLSRYEQYCSKNSLSTAGWEQFRKWALELYHPHYYLVEIIVPESISAHPDQKVEIEARIINRSVQAIPCSDRDKEFYSAVFSGSSENLRPDKFFGHSTRLPIRDIKSGESIQIAQYINTPSTAGTYILHFDIMEHHVTWFAHEGSPMPTLILTVTDLP